MWLVGTAEREQGSCDWKTDKKKIYVYIDSFHVLNFVPDKFSSAQVIKYGAISGRCYL